MDIMGLKAAADPTRARAAARDSMVCRMKVRSPGTFVTSLGRR